MSAGTTKRGIRVPDHLWHRVQETAAAQGINVSELIRQLLKNWVHNNKQQGDNNA